MAFDPQSLIVGSVGTLVVVLIAIFALISLIFGKARQEIKYVLTKLYSRTSLMLIALFDVVAAFDPTQTILGAPLGVLAGIAVFLSEWGLHDKFNKGRIWQSLVEGFIAAVIVLIPLPVAGLFVAWFGVMGDKKKK